MHQRVYPTPALQPTLLHALLAVLPTTVRQLRFDVRCCDPLFPLLRRFTQLETISIGGRLGNGAELQWDSPAAAATIPKFTSLRLDLRGDLEWDGSLVLREAPITSVPATWRLAMAAATRLSSLELRATWSMEVPLLCAALPALETLRCGCK